MKNRLVRLLAIQIVMVHITELSQRLQQKFAEPTCVLVPQEVPQRNFTKGFVVTVFDRVSQKSPNISTSTISPRALLLQKNLHHYNSWLSRDITVAWTKLRGKHLTLEPYLFIHETAGAVIIISLFVFILISSLFFTFRCRGRIRLRCWHSKHGFIMSILNFILSLCLQIDKMLLQLGREETKLFFWKRRN